MHLHSDPLVDAELGKRVPKLIGRGVFGVDGRFNFDAAAVVIVPFLFERDQLLTGGEFLKVKIVAQKHRCPARDICLHAGLGDDVADIVAEIVHVGHAHHAEFQTFGHGQRRRRAHASAVQPVLARENVVVEPFLQFQVVRVSAQQLHRKVRVAVDEAGH